jgi:hypothetical protein
LNEESAIFEEEIIMTTIQAEALETLKNCFRGEILLPEDQGFDQTRQIWNAMFDRRPAIIARCIGTTDVINAVNFARDNDLLVAVRGGRTQLGRQRGLRRGHHDRPVPHASGSGG